MIGDDKEQEELYLGLFGNIIAFGNSRTGRTSI